MPPSARSAIVSSFTIVKGSMIDETYAVFTGWDFDRSKRENLDRLRRENHIGARSETWLRDVAKVLNRRFDPSGRDRALVLLAKRGCDLSTWKPILLWHITRDEFLLRDFLCGWLFERYEAGAYRLEPEELHPYLKSIHKRGGVTEHVWSELTLRRVANGLLQIASDFGILKGGSAKEFASFHLPDASFLYLLHALYEGDPNPRLVVGSRDWRMFLMRPADVERELLRLHQFRKLDYQVAGSLVQLGLPCRSSLDWAARMVA